MIVLDSFLFALSSSLPAVAHPEISQGGRYLVLGGGGGTKVGRHIIITGN